MELPRDATSFSNGFAIQLSDGTVVLAAENNLDKKGIGVYRSSDRCKTFELAAIVGTGHELYEAIVAELADGSAGDDYST